MKPYWIEVTDRSIGRIICTSRVWTPELERRVYELIAQHIQERLQQPGTSAVDLSMRVSHDH